MKKRYIAMIAISSIGLLFGGLIYLGISSFPELVQVEGEVQEKVAAPIYDDTIIIEKEKVVEEKDEAESVGGGLMSYAPSVDAVVVEYGSASASSKVVVDEPTHGFDKKIHEFIESKESFEVSYSDSAITPIVAPQIETAIEEPVIAIEHESYVANHESSIVTAPLQTTKAKKAKVNNTKSVRSTEAVVETSLIVVGAVDLLSVILIKRRKRLFR